MRHRWEMTPLFSMGIMSVRIGFKGTQNSYSEGKPLSSTQTLQIHIYPALQLYSVSDKFILVNFNNISLLFRIIVILLAAIGVSTFTKNESGLGRPGVSQLKMTEAGEGEQGILPVGAECDFADDCKPCANKADRPNCSDKGLGAWNFLDFLVPGEVNFCWCKEHRLYPGETCFAAEECKPKSCLAKGEVVVCDGHPRVCKCKPVPEGKDQCLEDSECPKCEKEGETSRCAGNPKVCKPCGIKYLTVGEECTKSSQCLHCADREDTPFCSAEAPGEPEICKCKEHRFTKGHQCLADEDCKCKDRDEVAECGGHPRVCKCKPRGVKEVGSKCHADGECEKCADPKDTPRCSDEEAGEHKICKCKTHRLNPGERCFAHEECKPKSCVSKGENVTCAGHPQVCKCKAHHEGKDQCLGDSDCPACENEKEVRRCSGSPKECKPCETKYLKVGEVCTTASECLHCADNRDKAVCSAEAKGESPICKCKEHRFREGEECLADEECKCVDSDNFAECYGHPRTCKCTPRETKRVGEKCWKDEECEPCVDDKDTPHCSTGDPGEHKICKCKRHRLYLGENCLGAEECKPKPCVSIGATVECKNGICQCSGD